MARKNLTATTVLEMLQTLPKEEYEKAYSLHLLAQELGLQAKPRTGAQYYRIAYNTKKPTRTVFTIECNDVKWRVKASLQSLEDYRELAQECDSKLKEQITQTRTCTECNPTRCKMGTRFHLDNKEYYTCIGSGHFFKDLTVSQWGQFKNLIREEVNYIL